MTRQTSDFEIEYDSATPPLPPKVELPEDAVTALKTGAYLVRFVPAITEERRHSVHLQSMRGVLRVEAGSNPGPWCRASADVYAASNIVEPRSAARLWTADASSEDVDRRQFGRVVRRLREGGRGHPVFPRRRHLYYLQLHGWRLKDGATILEFATFTRDLRISEKWLPGMSLSLVLDQESLRERSVVYDLGLFNDRDSPIGRIDLGWFSSLYRSINVRFVRLGPTGPETATGVSFLQSDAVDRSVLDSPDGRSLQGDVAKYFQDAGVRVEIDEQPSFDTANAKELTSRYASRTRWSQRRLLTVLDALRLRRLRALGEGGPERAELLSGRKGHCHDDDWDSWEYLVFLVPELKAERFRELSGLMFDDRDEARTRRACAVALSGLKDTGEFTRLVCHELGHCLGLFHDVDRGGLMMRDPTDVSASAGFSREDRVRLSHLPDPWVRPDGMQFGLGYRRTPVEMTYLAKPVDGVDLRIKNVELSRHIYPPGLLIVVDFELRSHVSRAISIPCRASINGPVRSRGQHLVRCRIVDSAGQSVDMGSFEPPRFADWGLSVLGPQSSYTYRTEFTTKVGRLIPIGAHKVQMGLAWAVERDVGGNRQQGVRSAIGSATLINGVVETDDSRLERNVS